LTVKAFKNFLPSQSSVSDWSYGTNDTKDNGVDGTCRHNWLWGAGRNCNDGT